MGPQSHQDANPAAGSKEDRLRRTEAFLSATSIHVEEIDNYEKVVNASPSTHMVDVVLPSGER